MSDKEFCFVCGSCTSSIYSAFLNGEDCPICGAAATTSYEVEKANKLREQYKNKKISEELIADVVNLKKENAILKENLRMRHKYCFEIEEALQMCIETFQKLQEEKLIKGDI